MATSVDDNDDPGLVVTEHVKGSNKKQLVRWSSPYVTMALTVASSLFSSVNALLIRGADTISPLQFAGDRYIGVLVFALPIFVYRREDISVLKTGGYAVLLYRSVFGILTIIFIFMSLSYIPVGQASIILSSTPVAVSILARIFLKEPCGVLHSITVVTSVVGLVLAAEPWAVVESSTINSNNVYGISYAIAALVANSLMILLTRKAKQFHFSVVNIVAGIPGIIVCYVATHLAAELVFPRCGWNRLFSVAIGASNFVGNTLIILALQRDNAGPVITIKTCADILVSIIIQILVFKERLTIAIICGAALTVVSVILIGAGKWNSSRKSK